MQDFHQACQRYISTNTTTASTQLGSHQYAKGWRWQPPLSSYAPNTAGLSRRLELLLPSTKQVILVDQSIHYSSTWNVPVLYFSASTTDGQPLTLEQLLDSPVVHQQGSLPSDQATVFPSISQADHPRTGWPTFYLHPCQTSSTLDAILPSDPDPLLALQTFIMTCATAIEMRS